ncbi:MAG TPA: hypothetical protein VGD05_02280 [Pyrinomonadaceae bacterium]|jgi:hypothetical protein
MKIKYNDDKKEKPQSHEFGAAGGDWSANCGFEWTLSGYSATKQEAAAEIKRAAKLLISDIEKFLNTDLSEVPNKPRST